MCPICRDRKIIRMGLQGDRFHAPHPGELGICPGCCALLRIDRVVGIEVHDVSLASERDFLGAPEVDRKAIPMIWLHLHRVSPDRPRA